MTEAALLQPNINMELEINDVLKANIFTIKFVGLETPTSLPRNMQRLPNKVWFSLHWYTNEQATTTGDVSLRLSKQIEKYMSDSNEKFEDEEIKLAKTYYLIQEETLGHFNKDKPTIEQIIDNSMQLRFDVDPLLTRDPLEHERFAKYLNDNNLLIDVRYRENGFNTLYGRARVPLKAMLRQGNPWRVKAFAFDLHDE